ncbi:MAG TPA: alpha/beta hydrolase-fold protein [Bryobacteraceae bacterium]|nr:alpha/beta hydrolase-fold protein [Bryobacteraceae bacterium]
MKLLTFPLIVTGFLLAGLPVLAQAPAAPAPVLSPEVHADRTVTFRLRAPNAQEVLLGREGTQRVAMQKGSDGIWTYTTDALEPDFYGYSFVVDGVSLVDPSNSVLKPNLLNLTSMFHVPGTSPSPWDIADVPHGEVHHHFFHSASIGDDRDYYVYTPPGYEPSEKKLYPVLYLLHGYSDDASGWSAVGFANIILDNLIAQGKAKPMLIVMPLGYGAPEIVVRGGPTLRDPKLRDKNYQKFRESLFAEVIPQVEKSYHVSKDRTSRAIAGLSMGGAESQFVGLNALDRFAWVASFSAGGAAEDYAATFPSLDAKANDKLRLLWIACGTEDRLIEPNRKFREWLTSKDIKHVDIETPGMHTWMVWRRNLAALAPLLFQPKGSDRSSGTSSQAN